MAWDSRNRLMSVQKAKSIGNVHCTDSGWDGVNFLHSNLNGSVLDFWINSFGNTAVFYLLLRSACTVLRSYLFPLLSPQLGVNKRLGGDTAKTAGPNWLKRYFISYSITITNKTECGRKESFQGNCCSAGWREGWTAVKSLMGFCLIDLVCWLAFSFFSY